MNGSESEGRCLQLLTCWLGGDSGVDRTSGEKRAARRPEVRESEGKTGGITEEARARVA